MPFLLPVVGAIVGAVATAATFVVTTVGVVASVGGALVAEGLEFIGFSGAFAEAAAGMVTAGLIGAAKIAAVSAVSGLLHGPPSPGISSSSTTPVEFKADLSAGYPYVIGRTGTGGNIVHASTSAEGHNTYLHYFVVLSAAGPCQSFESFSANDEVVTFSGGVASGGTYAAKMGMTTQLGACPEAGVLPSPSGFGVVTEWDSACKMSGLMGARWALKADPTTYSTGTPKPLWVLKGAKVYDPRLDSTYPGGSGSQRASDRTTWAWSENPWLHALTWILGQTANGVRVLGGGLPVTGVDVGAYVEAANVADANAWKIGGVVTSKDDKWNVLTAMCQAGGGAPLRLGGLLSCIVSTPRVSLATATGDDMVGDVSICATQPSRSRINRAAFNYRSEDHGFEMVAGAPVAVSTYVSADGRTRTGDFDFPLVQSVDQAAQLAAYRIFDAREFGPNVFPMGPAWAGYKPGDCVTVNEPDYGLNNQKVLIVSRSRDLSTGCPTFTAVSETDAKHAAALGKTGTAPPTPSVTGIDATSIAAPDSANWSAVGTVISNEGVNTPTLVITGSIDNPRASAVHYEYRLHGDLGWNSGGSAPYTSGRQRKEIPVASGATFDAAISYVVRGVLSDRLIFSSLVAGSFAAPGDGSGGTGGGGAGGGGGTPSTLTVDITGSPDWIDGYVSGFYLLQDAAISGGVGPYSLVWSIVSGSGTLASSPTGVEIEIDSDDGTPTTIRVDVTDGASSTAFATRLVG